jgi:hypothetical protein
MKHLSDAPLQGKFLALPEAGNTCQGQTLYLITKVRELRTKKSFITLGPGLGREDESGGYCVCKPNYVGDRCEFCGPGYYGQPETIGKEPFTRAVFEYALSLKL